MTKCSTRIATATIALWAAAGLHAVIGQDATPAASPSARQVLQLTNLQQVITLPESALASNRYEARVRGVIVCISPFNRRFYIQDGNGGLQVNLPISVRAFRVGQQVEVTGTVAPGVPYPNLTGAKATVVREDPLPAAPASDAHKLIAGQTPFCLVKVQGVVRDMAMDGTTLQLRLTHHGVPFNLYFPPPGGPLPREWIDAKIEVTGISVPAYNARLKSAGFGFHSPGTNYLRVLEPGPGTLFERPLLSIAEAARKPERWEPRYRIAGTVTLAKPGIIYLDDGTGVMLVIPMSLLPKPPTGLSLEREPQTMLQPGERVEVIGVRHNWYSLTPTMIFAEYRRLGTAPLPAPQPVTIGDLQAGRYPGRIVTLEGRLVNQRGWGAGNVSHQLLMFKAGDDVFQASWESETLMDWTLKPDSYVKVTGVHESEGGLVKGRPTFQILLRSPADIVPATPPPAWTRPEIWKPGLAALSVGALACAWIGFQRRQMRRLRASEERFRALIDNSFDATIVLSAAGEVKYISPGGARLIGLSNPSPAAVPRIADLVHADDLPRVLQAHEEVLQAPGKSVRVSGYRVRAADGTTRVAEAIGTNCLQVPGVNGIVVNIRDITERHRAEDELRQLNARLEERVAERTAELQLSEERTRLIVDTALDAVITMDADGIICGWNSQAEKIFGWTAQEAMGRNLAETIIPPQFREAHTRGLKHFQKNGGGNVLNRRIELSALHRSGREFPAELTVNALRSGGTHVFSAFVRDITERKRAEQELLVALEREKELNQLKSNFVSLVSHEFRTPLEVILTSSDILDRYFDRLPLEKRAGYLRTIHDSVKRMGGMMEDVLLLGRVEAGRLECKPEIFDLAAFCHRVVDEMESATTGRCPIELQLDGSLAEACGDESLLRHVFANLLSNAAKYSPPGAAILLRVSRADENAVVTIADRGRGIPAADQARLFQSFQRGSNVTDTPGTGLGLLIVKKCVEIHCGVITFDSQEGRGTTFTITLPLFTRQLSTDSSQKLPV